MTAQPEAATPTIEEVLAAHQIGFGREMAVAYCTCGRWEGTARFSADLHGMHRSHVADMLGILLGGE